jgi:hypothetical protein
MGPTPSSPDEQSDAQVHNRRRECDSRGLGAAALLASKSLCQRLGDRGRAIGASDERGGDRTISFTENPVGNIAQKREAGDQNDHKPQLLRIPGAIGAEMAVGQKRQNCCGDDEKTRERFHILLVEPVDKPVKLGPQSEQSHRNGRTSNREAGFAVSGKEADSNCSNRGDCAGRIAMIAKLARVSDGHNSDHAKDDRSGRYRMAARTDQPGDPAA